jgi:hypothetical protein
MRRSDRADPSLFALRRAGSLRLHERSIVFDGWMRLADRELSQIKAASWTSREKKLGACDVETAIVVSDASGRASTS